MQKLKLPKLDKYKKIFSITVIIFIFITSLSIAIPISEMPEELEKLENHCEYIDIFDKLLDYMLSVIDGSEPEKNPGSS